MGSVNSERGYEAAGIIETRWDSFSRTDVVEVEGMPDRKDITIDWVAFSGKYRFWWGGSLLNAFFKSSAVVRSDSKTI